MRRPHRLVALSGIVAVVATTVLPMAAAAAPLRPLAGTVTTSDRMSSGTTRTVTLTRSHIVGGDVRTVDSRTVTVSVSSTSGLRDRQGIQVSWQGAHPTGGIVADQNSVAASVQEYPVVLMQCRGVDSRSVPKREQVRPETCWTQTPAERFQNEFNTTVPPWRLDRFAADSERKQYVGVPSPRPAQCFGAAEAERWVPFVAASGKTYYGGPNACAGAAPEATLVGSLNLPSNTTYAATAINGRGSATFNVRTSGTNASLGCSDRVKCSLVIVPIMGIGCDVDAAGLPAGERPPANELEKASAACTAKGVYEPGSNVSPSLRPDNAVTASLWWSASNWRNRVTVPLSFAPSASSCDITRSDGVSIFGSELMNQATESWAPTFCLDPDRTPVRHVQTGEPQARNLLKSGSIDAALVSAAPEDGYDRPVVNAPVAYSGFTIAYSIDGANGRPYSNLQLNARLLAKLMTASYPAITAVRNDYAALSDNPLNITSDPEFLALNPGVKSDVATQSAAAMLSLSSDSDVLQALTSYIDADPEARAWLDGAPDPWGMVVNPNYKGIKLPTEVWRSLDTFMPTSIYRPGVNDCLYQAPVPYLPLVAAPLTRLSYIGLAMQFSIANSQVVCTLPSGQTGSTEGAKLVALGRQTPGFRFMIGLMSLADAERYQVAEASLQTRSTRPVGEKFDSAAGRTFVDPNRSSLLAAAGQLRLDRPGGTWVFPYGKQHDDVEAAKAYPGTMTVYAALPTQGLAKADARVYADWLRYVVTDGQRQDGGAGSARAAAVGQLPAGYLPLTKSNGLDGLAAYSLRAADAVQAQEGAVPANRPSEAPDPPGSPGSTPGSTVPSGSGPTGPDSGADGSGDDGNEGDTGALVAESLGATGAVPTGAAALVLPGVIALALVSALLLPVAWFRGRLRRVQ